MDKILLIIPPHQGRALSEFPLGIGYLANQIKKSGFEPEILDINALRLSREKVVEAMKNANCRLFGISSFSTQYRYHQWLTNEIKAIDSQNLIIAGGPLATHQYELVLEKTQTDICVIGEGETVIAELLNTIGFHQSVKGIAFKHNGLIVVTPPQSSIDLDTLDHHPYHLFPMDRYFKSLGRGLNVSATRGCPYRCNFCSKTIPGLRQRSIKHLEEELQYLKKKYKLRGIRFSDELAVTNSTRGYELCDMFSRLQLNWSAQVRVDLVDLPLLKYMKKSGCVSIAAGLESGSQQILDGMGKGTTVQQNKDFIVNCNKVGILPWVQFIFGYLGENDETIKQSVEFFKAIPYVPPRPDYVGKYLMSSLATPLPGSKLFARCQAKGLIVNEEEYTLKLEHGYYIDNHDQIIMNLTSYSDRELIEKKEEMEQAIWQNYRLIMELPDDRSTRPSSEY